MKKPKLNQFGKPETPALTDEQREELMEHVRKSGLQDHDHLSMYTPTGKLTNDQDVNRQFDTGAQRDTGEGKLRMSLMPHAELKRAMLRYLTGAEKYGENNWMKGMPLSVYYDSMHRHLEAWWSQDDTEDHAAAVVWNMLCAMWTESNLKESDDRHNYPTDNS